MYVVVRYSKPNYTSIKTHPALKHIDKMGGEKIDIWCMVTHNLYTTNNSMKTHPLRDRHERRIKKRYVVDILAA